MWLTELKTIDLDLKKKYTFVVSLGAIEQHGPFLPLGTDTYCHDAIVTKAHKEYSRNIIFISWHGGNLGLLDRFVATEQKKHAPVKLSHIGLVWKMKIQTKKTKDRIKGPIDEHAGNTEISMMLAIKSQLVQKPDIKKHPKHNYNHDWEKHYVIESNPDGVVDKHPEWVISKKWVKNSFLYMQSY